MSALAVSKIGASCFQNSIPCYLGSPYPFCPHVRETMISEHPAGDRRPLDVPYPFDDINPSTSPGDTSSPSSILTFLLSATKHDSPESLKEDAVELQRKAYDVFPYPCIRSYAFLRYALIPLNLSIDSVERNGGQGESYDTSDISTSPRDPEE